MFLTLGYGIIELPEPKEIDWCDECDEDAMLCECGADDPDRAYDEMRERWMERNDD